MSTPTDTPTRPKRGNGITTPSRRGGSGRVLTDVIVDLGFVDRGTMDLAIERGTENGSAPERVLVQDGTLSDDQLARAVAERFGLDHIDLSLYRVDPDAAKLVQPAAVRRYQAVPVSFTGDNTLIVAMVDPANVLAIDDIAVMTGYEVRPAVSEPGRRRAAAGAPRGPGLRPRRGRARGRGRRRRLRARRARAVRARRPALRPARERPDQLRRRRRGRVGHPARAPGDQGGRRARRLRYPLRARRGGDAGPLPHRRRAPGGRDRARVSAVPAVISRIKILSDLDIAERRIPQDGRISLEVADKPIDLRVATLPAHVRREGRDANPRPEQGHDPARAAGHAPAGARAVHEGVRARPTAPCSSPARPAPASRPRCTAR